MTSLEPETCAEIAAARDHIRDEALIPVVLMEVPITGCKLVDLLGHHGFQSQIVSYQSAGLQIFRHGKAAQQFVAPGSAVKIADTSSFHVSIRPRSPDHLHGFGAQIIGNIQVSVSLFDDSVYTIQIKSTCSGRLFG